MSQTWHSRREFIKRIGIGLAALVTTRCRVLQGEGDDTPPGRNTARERLRACWQGLDELARETRDAGQITQGEDTRDRLVEDHRAALDELVEEGTLEAGVADQVQTAFDAAAYHVWRSNAPITCYEAVAIDYQPVSSSQLVAQAELLAGSDDLDADTVAMAQAAIARDVAFLNLPGDDVRALYETLLGGGQGVPAFDELELDISPEASQAAKFLVELLLKE